MDIDNFLDNIEKNMTVNDEHIKLDDIQKKALRMLFKRYDKTDVNSKNILRLHLWNSRFREILGITMFHKIGYNNL